VTVAWAAVGYSLAFSDGTGFIGNFDFAFLHNVLLGPRTGTHIPHLLFMAFQGSFCILTAALVSGAVVERMRFGPFLVFAALWSVFVYAVLAHWVFGGGWLAEKGTLDFAGGISVEMASGFSALAAALVVGARKDYGRQRCCLTTPSTYCSGGAPVVRLVRVQRWQRHLDGNSSVLAFTNTLLAPACTLVVWFILDLKREAASPRSARRPRSSSVAWGSPPPPGSSARLGDGAGCPGRAAELRDHRLAPEDPC